MQMISIEVELQNSNLDKNHNFTIGCHINNLTLLEH